MPTRARTRDPTRIPNPRTTRQRQAFAGQTRQPRISRLKAGQPRQAHVPGDRGMSGLMPGYEQLSELIFISETSVRTTMPWLSITTDVHGPAASISV